MTGAEFASKYTVLKPLDQRAVRSFVAQEQSTRRAVMVHWLDQLSASDRSAMLARLDRLPGDARERVLGIENVDGAPVVVTRMILDFDSFGKWLDRVAPVTQGSAPPAPSPGGFTDIFVASGQRGAPAPTDSPTVSWTPPAIAKPPEPKPEPKSEPKVVPSISVRFREPGSGPKPPAAAAPPPPRPAAPPPRPVAPPPPPPPAAPKAPAPGEFTRIFGATHVEPDPVPPPAAPLMSGSSGAKPSATSAMERVVAPRPAAPPPPPPPSPSSPWSGPPPVVPLPPSPSGSATPMPGANINLPPSAPVMPAQPVQSDFTRIIGAAHSGPSIMPPATPAAIPVAAPTPPAPPAPAAAAASKVVMPVLIGLGALALSALVLVIYFIIKR